MNSVADIVKRYKQDLEDCFDQCFDLIPFLNGVYDLKERTFRCARKCEYVSKTLDYNFEKVDFSDIEVLLNLKSKKSHR